MAQPLNLQRLPKASRLRFVQFKRTTPGNFKRLIAPYQARIEAPIVDNTHPLGRLHPAKYARTLPLYDSDLLTARAYPKALLEKPERPCYVYPPFPPATPTPYGRDGKLLDGMQRRVNMSLMHIVTKKLVGKKSVVRNTVKTRIRAAMGLIVTRGAIVENINGRDQIVSSGEDNGEKWIMQDWTYVFSPNLEIYRMPLTDLIKTLQKVLTRINDKCRKFEALWRQNDRASRLEKRRNRESNTPQKMIPSSLSRQLETPNPMNPINAPKLIPDELFLEDEEKESRPTAKSDTTRWYEKYNHPIRDADDWDFAPPKNSNSRNNDYSSPDYSEGDIRQPNAAAATNKHSASKLIFSRKPIIRPAVEEKTHRSRR